MQIPTADLNFKFEGARGRPPPEDPAYWESPAFRGMVESVRELGIINPLIVMEAPYTKKIYVYIGNQRLAVARELRMETVPCVKVTTEAEMKAAMRNYVEV